MATFDTRALTRIGDGPTATVYAARRDEARVALKVYPKRFDKRTMSAFTKEQAKLAAVSRIPSILTVEGVDELENGEPALRMQLCTESLAALVERRGPLPPADVVALGQAMAVALAAAHEAGVVHGGVSPSNVLFRPGGQPVLADFGTTLRQAFTRDPLHAIEYLPPETLRTGDLDESTDLYGLGAVLHYALSARCPHPGRLGEQPGERVLRILGEPVPAINAPDAPVALTTLIARLLAATPAHRPTSATRVAEQLSALLPTPSTQDPPFDDFASCSVRPVPPPPNSNDFDDFALAHPPIFPTQASAGSGFLPPPPAAPQLPPDSAASPHPFLANSGPPPHLPAHHPLPPRPDPAAPQAPPNSLLPPQSAEPAAPPPVATPHTPPQQVPAASPSIAEPLPGPPSPWAGHTPERLDEPAWESDDFGASGWGTAPTPASPPRRRLRAPLLVGGPLAAAMLAILLIVLLGAEPDELPITAREPLPPAPQPEVVVELAEPVDMSDKVKLNWHSTREMDYAVVIAVEGAPKPDIRPAARRNSMTLTVEPGRKYCFLIQASDGGERVYESEPRPLRGATCRNP